MTALFTALEPKAAMERLLDGKPLYRLHAYDDLTEYTLENGTLYMMESDLPDSKEESALYASEFFGTTWLAPQFDAREAMLQHPGAWVAEVFVRGEGLVYLGFDPELMQVVMTPDYAPAPRASYREVQVKITNVVHLDRALPLGYWSKREDV